MKKLIVLGLVALTAFSCVSTKKFNSMKAEALRLEGELTASKSRLEDMGGLERQTDGRENAVDCRHHAPVERPEGV